MQYIAIFSILSAMTVIGSSENNNGFDMKTSSDSVVSYSDPLQKTFPMSGDRILFDINSYSVRPSDIQVLSSLGSWLEKYDCDFIIEGHTDEQGSRNSSIALGLNRAYAVFNYFLARGISVSRMKVTSYGKEMPDVSGHDENAYEKNRRAVIVLKECRSNG
ncbi:OmpA family protein [Candidatus Liberibacter africanus]|uniref:OmpA/MotB n=1 Tax=Candidatus Liberibacter africanus PTSAPSY TaxID=1277257 RepID=A0A0G3I501_LIBAF|nr:OmpA family protein [Candidatus Liberibacter africanus]AKK20355.1 OmpA/MotB [Candidatus Liberibacter africanus PTSAPSY]QTP64098.1 OmpA family protein [Candidatus Liberibacter africanus]